MSDNQTFQIQYKARHLSEEQKYQASKIARQLFGMWDWQGVQNNGLSSNYYGLAEYINRSVMRQIRPEGATWLVGESQYVDRYGDRTSTYYIKQF